MMYIRAAGPGTSRAPWHILLLHVAILIGKVNEHLKRDHLDAKFGFVLLHQLLRVIWTVERFAARIISGSRMVASPNKVINSMVAPNDRVKHGLFGSSHAHGE